MGNFEERNDTHIVIKKEDVLKYLEEPDQIALEGMLYRILRSRAEDNKNPFNKYYIVNKDESYAEVVHGVIMGGEAVKNGQLN